MSKEHDAIKEAIKIARKELEKKALWSGIKSVSVIIITAVVIFAYLKFTQYIWNYIMPSFGLPMLTWWGMGAVWLLLLLLIHWPISVLVKRSIKKLHKKESD